MNKILLIKFLRYLKAESDGMLSSGIIDHTSVGNLNRDLAKLKSELADSEGISESSVSLVKSLNLVITERYLPGGKKRYQILRGLLHFSSFGRWRNIRNAEKLASEMANFKEDVERILYAVENNFT